MARIGKKIIYAVFSFVLSLMVVIAGIFPAVLPVSAEETSKSVYEQTNVLDDLKKSTIGDQPFDLTQYNFDEKKETKVLSFVEYCYSFYSAKQDNYGFYIYVYNPQGLQFNKYSPLNKIQFTVGSATNENYTKYNLKYLNCSTETNYEGLFYKFRVDITDEQKEKILSAVNSTERYYRVSGVELVKSGDRNATEFGVATTYKYSGYAAGYGSNENAPSTLICNTEETDVLSLNVHPTVFRPEGTNGKNEYTQDSLHSVYFAVPNEYIKKYGAMTAVHAQWLNAVLAPALVTGNGNVYNAVKEYLGEYMYGGDYWWWSDKNKNNDMPYEIIASERMGSVENTELSMPRWAYNANEVNQRVNNPTRYINYLYMLFFTGGGTDSADDYTVSSEMILDALEKSTQYGGVLINGKYSSKFFDSYDSKFTEVNIKADETYQLTNAVIDKSWWDRLWGYKGDVTTTTFDNIQAIYPVKDSDMTGSPEDICKRLYISEADYENFKDFYNKNKNLCQTYLFRYQTSEYIAMEAATWETDNGSFWEGDGIIRTYAPDRIDSNNYFFQQTVNLDFDIIDVTFSNGEKDTVIPVVSNPIDVVPDATPPVLTISDEKTDWLKLLKIVVAVILGLALLIFLWPLFKPLLIAAGKGLLWLIKAPFKAIGNAIRKRKRRKEEQKNNNGENG